MWHSDKITVEIDVAEGRLVIVRIIVPVGSLTLMGTLSRVGRVLYVEGAHVGGLSPGALGRSGLNAVGRKLLEETDAEEIIIAGSARTTGRRSGRVPWTIRFPKR